MDGAHNLGATHCAVIGIQEFFDFLWMTLHGQTDHPGTIPSPKTTRNYLLFNPFFTLYRSCIYDINGTTGVSPYSLPRLEGLGGS